MAKGDSSWESAFGVTAYPTTVVIDRYGTVAMMHTGYLTSKEDFAKVFDYFTADNYTQSVVRNLSDIEKGIYLININGKKEKVVIGMSQNQCREALGNPQRINRTTTASIIYEQWVYYNRYLYFENGKLVTIQD